MRSVLKTLVCLFLIAPMVACQAEQVETFEAGVHYELLAQPVPTSDPDRIEVVEMFWYGCSHCYNFEPQVHSWSENLPQQVYFSPLPAIWHTDMELHAKAYFAAKAMKVLDPLHQKLFEAMNLEKQRLKSADEIADIFEKNGVDRAKFLAVFDSFGVNQSVKMVQSKQRAYRIQGTPELIVNGKYRISARQAGSQASMLKVADYLIEKESQAK